MNGKEVASYYRQKIKAETEEYAAMYGRRPVLAVVLVGNDPASVSYVTSKRQACEEMGFGHKDYTLDADTSEAELLSLVDQLNSLEIPDEAVDEEAVFRVVSFSSQLLEKIMIFDNGRDDRVMELYKAVVTESIREDWPDVTPVDLIYYANDGEEYLIIWDESTAPGDEKLTVLLDDGLYKRLESDYGYALRIPAGKYAEVDSLWLAERAEI